MLFEATVVCDSPVQDPARDAESSSATICDSPVQDPALAAESSSSSYPYPPPPPANRPPTVSANSSTVSANEGSSAVNSGLFADPDYDFVTLSASLGSVVGSGSSGSWSWNYLAPDGPATHRVTITATDSRGMTAQTTFTLEVSNVEPTFTLSSYSSEVYVNTTYMLLRSPVTDPGQDTISSWTISWGDGTPPETFAGNPGSFPHVYTTEGVKGISATAHDEDGSYTRGTSVNVILPEVSVTAGDYAAENGRRSTAFRVARTGPASAPLDVFFTLGGSATPGTADSAGVPTPADADYTVTGAVRHGEGWKVTIPANAANASVTANTLNDSAFEGTETIHFALLAAPAYAIAAGAAVAAANLEGLNVARVEVETESDVVAPPPEAKLNALVEDLADPELAQGAEEELLGYFRNAPSLETYFDDKLTGALAHANQNDDDPTVVRLRAVLNSHPNQHQVVLRHIGNNKLSVRVRQLAPLGEFWEVTVTVADVNKAQLSLAGAGAPAASVQMLINPTEWNGEQITVTTLAMEGTDLDVRWRRVTVVGGEHVPQSGSSRTQKLVLTKPAIIG